LSDHAHAATATGRPVVAHQFDDVVQQHEAAELGMWIFLVTEILFFGGMFTVYVVYRSMYPAAFAAGSNHLDVTLGTVNTGILIASSLTMALAVHAAQVGHRRGLVVGLLLTILLGGAFLAIKAVEYGHKFQEGHVPGPAFRWTGEDAPQVEIFYSLYFALTGVHALHMVIGIAILAVLAVLAWRGRIGGDYCTPVELTGLYWHFVDIVWIFLFPLLYLLGRHVGGH
jgi:cytochrome c oxidase subunit 3